MFDLFPEAVSILSSNLDLLGKVTSIVESYILLDAPTLLQVSNDTINILPLTEYFNQASGAALFDGFLAALKSEAVTLMNAKDLLITLNLLIQVTPSGLWGEAMHNSGLFAHVLTTLIDGEVCSPLSLNYDQLTITVGFHSHPNRTYMPPRESSHGRPPDVLATNVGYGFLAECYGKFPI